MTNREEGMDDLSQPYAGRIVATSTTGNTSCNAQWKNESRVAAPAEKTQAEPDVAGLIERLNDWIAGLPHSHPRRLVIETAIDTFQRQAAELAEVKKALSDERDLRKLGQNPDVHWESLRDLRRATYEATDAALSEGKP